jgi:hypothetical protein
MQEIADHEVYFPEGFYDMNRWPERIEGGGKRTVTRSQFRQMSNSDPTVELRRIVVPQDILQRLVSKAREEKAAKVLVGMKTAASEESIVREIIEWQPIGWYKGQLKRNDGMEGIDA